MWTLDFGCINFDFCRVDVRFWLCGRWILGVWTLNFGCVDVGILLFGRWILVG